MKFERSRNRERDKGNQEKGDGEWWTPVEFFQHEERGGKFRGNTKLRVCNVNVIRFRSGDGNFANVSQIKTKLCIIIRILGFVITVLDACSL